MGKNYHSKSGGNRRRFCNSLLLLLAIITSGCSALNCSAQQKRVNRPAPSAEVSIIPQPDSVTINKGYFEFSRDTKIIAADGAAVKAANSLNDLLMESYGFTLEMIRDANQPNAIIFLTDQNQAGEGYFLKIEPNSIQITGSERGMFYGIQSLQQLFPINFNGEARIPSASIRDAPRFRYRGMHLDVSRHFMPVEFIKKYIRLISRYKYNFFHWHLTDDQGWRIEIKKYPLLTKIGSKRRETVIGWGRPYAGDNTPVEGFYTQEEIREIVEYAKERYVTIIPEIDLPGHSSAALASYPSLGCTKNYPYKVQTTWGGFPDIFCPTEFTFQFLEDVLTEVIDLFPDSPYVHLGGDEVKLDSWRRSRFVQDLKRANKLSSEREVQRWFVERVARFANSKGKNVVVWDEMVDFGLPPNATVMYWRDSEAARRNTVDARRTVTNAVVAAKAKHEVIMTPDTYTYFDHPQGDEKSARLSFYSTSTLLEKVYSFEPVPAGLNQEEAKYIIGGQGCIWTELSKSPENVEYMVFPRAIALAEVLWSKRENRDFRGFSRRLFREFPNLDREQVNYQGSASGSSQPTAQVFQPDFPGPVMPITGREPFPVHRELEAASLSVGTLPYCILLPPDYEKSGRRYAVLYLLHDLSGDENDWWENSKLAQYALKYHLIIVTPGVGDSWYANSAGDAGARYEDVIVRDLIPYIDAHYRTIAEREGRAIAGVSMGGVGAMKFALRYPHLFAFAGSMSGAFDVPLTARLGKTPSAQTLRDLQLVFGDEKSQVRRENNVFLLLTQAVQDNAALPYLYVSSGKSDPYPQVYESNPRFAKVLRERGLRFEYNERPGTHDWRFWDSEIFLMLDRMCVFMKTICS